jgi:hypothetical protein
MAHLWVLLFDVFVLGGLCFMGAVVFLWRYRAQRSRRAPARNLLRSPGESLRARIEDAQWDIASYLAAAMLPLPAVLGVYFGSWVAGGGAPTAAAAAFLALCGVGAQAWLGWKLWGTLARLRRLRLGHEAQMAMGQELSQLGRSGYRIFHDFPAGDGSHIDHVLVGPAGVFVVESYASYLPDPLLRAQGNADWLQAWLSGAVGQPIPVWPVVAGAGEIQGYFEPQPGQARLSTLLIQQIARELDQKGRDLPAGAGAAVPAA